MNRIGPFGFANPRKAVIFYKRNESVEGILRRLVQLFISRNYKTCWICKEEEKHILMYHIRRLGNTVVSYNHPIWVLSYKCSDRGLTKPLPVLPVPFLKKKSGKGCISRVSIPFLPYRSNKEKAKSWILVWFPYSVCDCSYWGDIVWNCIV